MNINKFSVSIYGNIEKYNDVLSKARCRIFYKFENRNGGYITDDFADKLISTIPYTPIKGIYNSDEKDYTDHGIERNEGRIYGIVPEQPNFAWEKHVDEDGIEREYACVDVLLFTAIYKEANEIFQKAQSMELYEPSIKGDWQFINGQKCYVYTDACFLGLQVLGEKVEPCFEGAAFYTLYNSLDKLCEEVKSYTLKNQVLKGGAKIMDKFKLSHTDIYRKIFKLLNLNYNKEGSYEFDFDILQIYDSYVVVRNVEDDKIFRVYYTKNDNTDEIVLGEREECFIIDVTSDEYNALIAVQQSNGGNFNKIDEIFNKVSELENQISEFETKKIEMENTISTLTIERDTEKNNLQTIAQELEELKEYKYNIETNKKKEIIKEYAILGEDILNKYSENLDNYSIIDLDKELAYEMKKVSPQIFTNNNNFVNYVPNNDSMSEIERILSKYEDKKWRNK